MFELVWVRYILDKHYLDWLFENFEVRKQLKEVLS